MGGRNELRKVMPEIFIFQKKKLLISCRFIVHVSPQRTKTNKEIWNMNYDTEEEFVSQSLYTASRRKTVVLEQTPC